MLLASLCLVAPYPLIVPLLCSHSMLLPMRFAVQQCWCRGRGWARAWRRAVDEQRRWLPGLLHVPCLVFPLLPLCAPF